MVISEAEKTQARATSSFGLFSIFMTFASSLLIVFLLGQTIEASWLLLGTIQMMSLIPLLNMNLPIIFREFSKHLAVLHGEPEAFPNLFEYIVNSENAQPFNYYFYLMNFKTMYLVLNSGRKILIWTGVFLLSFISAVLYDLIGWWK